AELSRRSSAKRRGIWARYGSRPHRVPNGCAPPMRSRSRLQCPIHIYCRWTSAFPIASPWPRPSKELGSTDHAGELRLRGGRVLSVSCPCLVRVLSVNHFRLATTRPNASNEKPQFHWDELGRAGCSPPRNLPVKGTFRSRENALAVSARLRTKPPTEEDPF